MKVALIHELLTMRGGAERMLRVFKRMFPDAPLYTLLYNEKKLGDWFPKEQIRTSYLQRYAHLSTNHHLYLPFFPRAVEQWDFSKFDLVISTSSAFTHGIITNSAPRHISYIHSPTRYLWDRTHDVQSYMTKGLLGPLKKMYLSKTFHTLRIWDSEAADRADQLLAPSQEVARRIQLYWNRESTVIHPPIDDKWFAQEVKPKKDYYFLVSTLTNYKRIELAIEACNQLKRPLCIAGEGPAYTQLKTLAGPTVSFLGYVPHTKLATLYSEAKATLFPGEEDFGLVPVESMACGTPVIAYNKGGALETVLPKKTGLFFTEPTGESLAETMEEFEKQSFDPHECQKHATQFSEEKFLEQMREVVEKEMG